MKNRFFYSIDGISKNKGNQSFIIKWRRTGRNVKIGQEYVYQKLRSAINPDAENGGLHDKTKINEKTKIGVQKNP